MVAAFDPARLSTRLTLEKPVELSDGQGGSSTSFQAIGIVHAHLEPVAVDQLEQGAASSTITRFRARLRRRDDLAAGMRLTRPGRILVIRAVIDADARGRYQIANLEEETS